MQVPSSFPGSGQRLGSSHDSSVQVASQFVIHKVLPKLYEHAPAPLVSLVQDSFWKVPTAAFALSVLYDKTFALDAILAVTAGFINYADKRITNGAGIKTASLSLLALHVMKSGYNSYHCFASPNFSSALHASFDLCIASKLGLIVLNNSPYEKTVGVIEAAASNQL